MGYVGNTPAERYARMDKQTITGDGTTGPYTLDHSVGSEQELEVFVNNVRQEPGSGKAYTVSGNQLTMGGNVDSTDDFYLIYQGKTIGTVTPPDESITRDMLVTDLQTTRLQALDSGNSFTLDYTPTDANSILVFVNGLYQTPGRNYSVSTNTLSLGDSVDGADSAHVLFLGGAYS